MEGCAFATPLCDTATMLEWSDLRYVLAVHREGSFKAASKVLAVDKATIGRRVSAVEARLGVRLVRRSADGCSVTEAGAMAVHAALEMEMAAARLTAGLAGEAGPRAVVRITAPTWFVAGALAPALPGLLRAQRDLDVVFGGTTRVVNLARREADVAIRNVLPDQESMTVRRVSELGSALYASRSYARRHPLPEAQAEISEHALVGYERTVTFLRSLDWLNAMPHAKIVARVSDALALAAVVQSGAGIGVLPCFVGDAMAELVRVPFVGVHREKIWVVVPTEMRDAPGVRAVLDFVVQVFRAHGRQLRGA